MKRTIKFIEKATFSKQLIGSSMILFAVVTLFIYFYLYGLFILAIGLILVHRKGAEIDLDKKQYRELLSIYGFLFGLWEKLPENIKYLSVFKTKENKRYRGFTASATVANEIIKLLLFYNKNNRIEIYKTTDLDDAFNNAKFISDELNIKILDATIKPSKWL